MVFFICILMKLNEGSYDLIGKIAIVKFSKETKATAKKKFANKLLKENKSITTVVEKIGKFRGRLRKQETRFIAGDKTKEALHKENGCVFRLNVDEVYFSPRLSNERKEISENIKKNDLVLVMFSGLSPFPIVIAKNSKAKKVYSNEINREANKYGKLNIELNKLKDRVFILPGDVKKVIGKIGREKFDVIVMPRPRLKETFLKEAFSISKKGTRIFYYDFCKEDETKEIVEKIKLEAKKARKKIKILKTKVAGEIAPYSVRVRVDFKVL